MATELQKKWEDKIRRALQVREDWAKEFKVQMARDYFEGRQNPGWPEEEWITINKVYSHLMSQLPSLYSLDPYFYVKLKKSYSVDPNDIAAWEARGRTRQAMLNYLKVELEMKTHARMGIQDAHFAYGALKVRRASDEEDHPHAGEPILDDSGKELKDDKTGEGLIYPKTKPVNERYELDRVHPDDILFDEDAGPLEKSWKWLAQKICMTKEEALDDRRFNSRVINAIKGRVRDDSKVEPEKTSFSDRLTSNFKKKDKEDEFIDFWEIYDLKKKEWLMIAENAEDLALKPRGLPPGVENHPYSFLRFTLRDKSPYPIPPMFNGIDPQREYNMSRSRIQTHRKRFNRKYEAVVTKMEDPDTDLAKLESGDDGTVVRVMANGAVTAIQDAPLDQQTYTELSLLNNDMVEIFGSADASRGIASSDSATEASILDTRQDVKEGDRLSMVVDWITTCARKLDQLVQFHIDEDQAVKITGGPRGEEWVNVKQQDYEAIRGEFEYSVNTGASRPRLPDIERAQWIAFMSQVIIPFPHILTKPNIMKRMAEMFGIEDEAAVEELRQLGEAILTGQMPFPGQQGGGASDNPIAQIMGAALGPQGGNVNGGGAQVQ